MKKYLLLAVVVTLLASGSYIAEKSFFTSSIVHSTVSETVLNESPKGKLPEIEGKVNVPHTQTASTGTATNTPETVPTQTSNVTLSVAGKSYPAFAPVDSTVLDMMRTLASTSDFTFTGHDYPSLGFFVDSINGQKTEKSYNWILYINGKLSNTGASQTTLKAGDAVEWRYEKNY